MGIPWEALSRLRAGDLPPDEAVRLRAAIASDPELAAAWAQVGALDDAIRALPRRLPVPDGLDAAVLTPARRRPARTAWLAAGVAGLLAAAGLAVALRPQPPVRIVTTEGAEVIEGRAEVLAGGVPVVIDGRARIRVEPEGPVARGTGAEDEMKLVGAGLGGVVLGAAVTVWVDQGTAAVGPVNEQVVLTAGEQRTVQGPAPERAPSATRELPADATVEELRAEVRSLEAEVERLRFSEQLARGQLAGMQGEAVPWPEDVPAAFRAESLGRALEDVAAKYPGLQVDTLDCAEFPCVAILKTDGPLDAWKGRLQQIPEALQATTGASGDVMMSISQSEDDGVSKGAVMLAVAPEDTLGDSAVGQRTKFRGETLLSEALDE